MPRRVRRDPGWPLLAALEVVDPAGQHSGAHRRAAPDLTQREIAARLGATWIPADVVTGFVRDLLDDPRAETHHSPLTATWKVDPSYAGKWSVAATSEWGTGRADAYTLIADALNQRPTIVYDLVDERRGSPPLRAPRSHATRQRASSLHTTATFVAPCSGWTAASCWCRPRRVGLVGPSPSGPC